MRDGEGSAYHRAPATYRRGSPSRAAVTSPEFAAALSRNADRTPHDGLPHDTRRMSPKVIELRKGGRQRVLVAHQRADVRHALRTLIEQPGVAVCEAADG